MQSAAQAYATTANKTASPRELEANLLLRAASRLQAVREAGDGRDNELDDALVFNRKLWSVFLTSVTETDNPLPAEIRQNIVNLGVFVLSRTLAMATDRNANQLAPLITINREVAAGLMARA